MPDNVDNCWKTPNASQWDSDKDGFGDACDGDFDGDKIAGENDRAALVQALNAAFGTSRYRMSYDFDLNGIIDASDLSYFDSNLRGKAPGPSGFVQ